MTTPRDWSPSITVLIPARNEEAALPITLDRVRSELVKSGTRWEIILVDDGSTDRTREVWQEAMNKDARLGLVALTRNFGKESALLAGMEKSQGDVVIPMDADGQDPPALIHDFLLEWKAGYDSVVGVRRRRDDPLIKRACARLHYSILRMLSPLAIPAEAGDFRLLDRSVVADLLKLPERERYTKGLYAWVGRSTKEVLYDRPARVAGKPTQHWGKLLSLSIDGITSFSAAPLRLLLFVGALSFLGAIVYGLYFVYAIWVLHREPPNGYITLLGFVLFFGGIQTAALGLIGEYLARIYRETKQRPPYLIADHRPAKVQE